MSDQLTLSGGTANSTAGGTLMTLEALGDGTQFNNVVDTIGTDGLLAPRIIMLLQIIILEVVVLVVELIM